MIVGLDIGSKLIKAAVLGGNRRKPRLIKFVTRQTPEGPDGIAPALEALFLEERIPRDRVCSALTTQETVIREITVPFTQDEAIRRTIKFEAENAFHGATVENMVIDYHQVSTGKDKSRLLVVGVQKKPLERHLGTLSGAGIDPVMVGLDLGAIYNAAVVAGVITDAAAAVIIDVGATLVRVVVAEDGKIRAARGIRLRSSLPALPQEKPALPGPGPAPPPEGEKTDTEKAEPDVEVDEKTVARVVAEISRTIVGCRLRKPVRDVWSTGGGPGRAAILAGVSEKLSLKPMDLEVGRGLGADGPGSNLLGTVAIGMGLAGLGRDAAGMDFRQEEFRYQRAFEKARRGLATVVCVVFLGLVFLSWTLQRKNVDYNLRLRMVQRSQVELVGIMFPEEELSGPDAWQIIQKKRKALEKRFEGKDTEIRSTVHDFRTVSEAVDAAGGGLQFTQIRLMQKNSRLEGEALESGAVYKFREELDKAESMSVASPNIRNLEDGRVKFTIDIRHKES